MHTQKKAILSAALLLDVFSMVGSCTSNVSTTTKGDASTAAQSAKPDSMSHDVMVARGRYLVTAGGCNDCHSPKVMTKFGPMLDTTRLLSGAPASDPLPPVDKKALQPGYWVLIGPHEASFVGPWGVSFAANLTPDTATGIGAWTAEVFMRTMRTGKHLGLENGRPVLPPMPWQGIAQMTDYDLTSVFTYLHSLPRISNRVHAPVSPEDAMKGNL